MDPCRHWQSRLTAWFDGEVSELDAGEVRAHLLECGGCRAAVNRWKGLQRDMESLQPEGPSAEVLDRMAWSFEAAMAGEVRGFSAALRIWNAAAALLLLASAAFFVADRVLVPRTARASSPLEIERAYEELVNRPSAAPVRATEEDEAGREPGESRP